jgi:hypothetical protein
MDHQADLDLANRIADGADAITVAAFGKRAGHQLNLDLAVVAV